MVSLPVSRPTNSSTIECSSASDSPVFRSIRISTIMGTMTLTQPERITERVPSKSKRAARAPEAFAPVRTCSMFVISEPVFPFAGPHYIRAQAGIRDCVREHKISQIARPHHPPVVQYSGREPDVPVRSMLAREKQRDDPERRGGIGPQRNRLEAIGDQPAHQPSAPKQLHHHWNDGHRADRAEPQARGLLAGPCGKAGLRLPRQRILK